MVGLFLYLSERELNYQVILLPKVSRAIGVSDFTLFANSQASCYWMLVEETKLPGQKKELHYL